MSDIKGQLIKNSYNYVLQSDLFSGIVYRIGGDVPINPKFISGLTVNTIFTYSNGSEVDGYVLTCDASGNATWKPVSGSTPSSGVTSVTATNGLSGNVTTGAITLVNTAPDQIVTISGGTGITTGGTYPNFTIVNSAPDQTVTITGGTKIQITGTYPNFGVIYTGVTIIQGITGITGSSGVSAITNDYGTSIVNTAPDQIVTISGGTGITTGGTYPNFTLINSAPDQTVIITGGTNIQITGAYPSFGVNFTGSTSSTGDYLPLSGGTVTGGTNFTDGLTANTISATTYLNLPVDVFVTGGTYTSGNAIFTNNTGGTFTVSGFNTGGGGGQIFYLNISQSKNGNRYLSTTGSTAAEQSTGVTIANGVTSTIASFQSDQLNITLIPGGIWAFYLHSYKSNTNASFNIFVEVYKRTSGGTETLLFTTDPTAVTTNSPNPSMGLSDAYFSGSPILVSDSIVARVRATNTSNQSHTVTLFSEGSQNYSYAVSTLPTQQGLTCDTLSGCSVIQTIQTDVSNKYDKSGGTITGNVIVQNGLTANTISATTYQNLPISGLTAGQNINISGTSGNLTISFTGTTGSSFTGGTVSGPTNFTNGLTANTISATTYQGLSGSIVFQFDGAGGVIPTGQTGGYYVLPYNFQITSWRLLSTTRGTTTALAASIVIDTYSSPSFPNTTSIWGGSKPSLTSASSNTATGLNINLTSGNLIGFNVDSSTLGQLITLTLIGIKS